LEIYCPRAWCTVGVRGTSRSFLPFLSVTSRSSDWMTNYCISLIYVRFVVLCDPLDKQMRDDDVGVLEVLLAHESCRSSCLDKTYTVQCSRTNESSIARDKITLHYLIHFAHRNAIRYGNAQKALQTNKYSLPPSLSVSFSLFFLHMCAKKYKY
jgi:hypothetical protein